MEKSGISGGCHCGAIRYEVSGAPHYSALCHCSDCRRASGAPMVGWALFDEAAVSIAGEPVRYRSSTQAVRQFCGNCGTGLFYTNADVFPGKIDIQIATLDDPAHFPPAIHVQMAEAPAWFDGLEKLPKFDRYPG